MMQRPRDEVQGLTIDSATSRDLDDALWFERVEGGGYAVLVTIADVASHVPKGSEADRLAKERIATRYFASGTSTMLPGELEQRLSLLPNGSRAGVTTRLVFNADGEIDERQVSCFRSRIRNAAKLAYPNVPVILADKASPWNAQITIGVELALKLLARRRRAGALAIYDLNAGWMTTEDGTLRVLKRREDTIGQILVQEMMIAANAALAAFLIQNGIPALLRNHQARSVAPARDEIMQELERAFSATIDVATLRSKIHLQLERARYDVVLRGHYGLNLPAYVHLTSPLRRLADLVTQQQLVAYLTGRPMPYTTDELRVIAERINTVEQEQRDERDARLGQVARAQATTHAERITSNARRLHAADTSSFERACKVTALSSEVSSEPCSASFALGVRARLEDRRVTLRAMLFLLLGSRANGAGWHELRRDVADPRHLTGAMAVSIWSMVPGILEGWGAIAYDGVTVSEQMQGRPPLFRMTAAIVAPWGTEKATRHGNARRDAQQWAALALLLQCADLEPIGEQVSLDAATLVLTAKRPPIAVDKHPVSALQEYAATTKQAPPSFAVTFDGPDHQRVAHVVCTFAGLEGKGDHTQQKEARRLAAAVVVQQLLAPKAPAPAGAA
jgi:ribonuclease R